MSADATKKQKAFIKKGKIVYISSYKKRNVINPYSKTDDSWYHIKRANDNDKELSYKAARLISKLLLVLHKNNDYPVYKDNYWFSKFTSVYSSMQNARIRSQINHIFNFQFYKRIVVEKVLLKDVYKISLNENAFSILNFEDVIEDVAEKHKIVKKNVSRISNFDDAKKNIKIDEEKILPTESNGVLNSNEKDSTNVVTFQHKSCSDAVGNRAEQNILNVAICQHKSCSHIVVNKVIEDISPRYLSMTNKEKLKIKKTKELKKELEKSSSSWSYVDEHAIDNSFPNPESSSEAKVIKADANRNGVQRDRRLPTAMEEKEIHLQRLQRKPSEEGALNLNEVINKLIKPSQTTGEYRVINCQQQVQGEQTLDDCSFDEQAKVLATFDRISINEKQTIVKQEQIHKITDDEVNQTLLSKAILNAFGACTASKIQERCEFTLLDQGKLKVKLIQGVRLEEHERTKLKACIQSVYGEYINIVTNVCTLTPTLKIANNNHTEEKREEAVSMLSPEQQWVHFKNNLINNIPSSTREHMIRWCSKLQISEDSRADRLVLLGSSFFIEQINQYRRYTEEAVLKSGVDIELRCEHNSERPTEITKEKIMYWRDRGNRNSVINELNGEVKHEQPI